MQPISVIISSYNRLDYLHKALISIRSQSVIPAEVIVSDDGSGEPIVAFLQEIAPLFDFKIRLVMQEDRGFRLARCKNNGIRASRENFLVFWDQDVVGTKGYLETFWKQRKPGRFLVSYPVRLNEEQTRRLTEEDLRGGRFDHLLKKEQIAKIHRQYRKDLFYFWWRKLFARNDTRPKLRGGVFAAFKEDLLKVNGFDEKYQGWGNEDDDLGRRLYAAGIVGFNPFYHEFPLHLYHPPNHQNGQRVNRDYYEQRQKEIRKGKIRAEHGIENPLGEDEIRIMDIK